jgi:glycosyltransferase involved in cell wall biosynthesis
MKPSFAAIVRTTGSRPELLLDTLQSLFLQESPCHAIVVVHGGDDQYSTVKRICENSAGSITILHAGDMARRRGYPINVGLDYCAANLPAVDYLFLLDDDDIVYPFFTRTMWAAFLSSEADVVYAASNRRSLGQPKEPGYAPKPICNLFRENFIPSNSYAIRHSALIRSSVRMSEEMEYTEDWHFLLRLLAAGLRFHPLAVTLSEFRIVSDGNLTQKKSPEVWKSISLEIRRFINTTSFPIPGSELANLALWSATPADFPSLPRATAQPIPESLGNVRIAELRNRITDLENSLSWRCTAPLRYALGLLLGSGKSGTPRN